MKPDFREVFERNKKLVYHICLIHLKNPDDADDAVQEVFLKYLKSEDRFTSEEHIRSWLVTVARTTCTDKIRYWIRRGHFTDSELNEAVTGIFQEQMDGSEAVITDFLKMDDKYGLVLYLYYVQGYNTEEISKITGSNLSTVKTRLQRGREKLKNHLKEAGYEER